MRVAYVVSRFPSTTETFIAREMTAVRARGIDIGLFALRAQEGTVAHEESDGFVAHVPTARELVTAHAYWLRRDPGRLAHAWWAALSGNARSPRFLLRSVAVVPMAAWFAQRAQSWQVDHVHAHWATHSALAAWVVHTLTGIPYSITAHAHDLFVSTAMLGRKLRDAAFVAVISEYNADYLLARFPAEVQGRLVVVRCGVDPERYEQASPSRGTGVFRLLCVASLEPYKGHEVLLDALARLHREGCRVHTTIVGDGPLRESLQERATQLGLADDVTFTGALDSGEVARLLSASDAFALASIVMADGKMEGIPVALMEAGAAGLPSVASAISGIPELVQHRRTGLLVPPGDADALAEALRELAVCPGLRADLGRQARERVLEEFTVDQAADRLVSLFRGAREGVAHA